MINITFEFDTLGNENYWVVYYKNEDKVVYFDTFGDLPLWIELQKYFKGFDILSKL